MSLKDPTLNESDEFFKNVDLSKTQAYSIGLNGIYINRKGRERKGVVDSDALADKIKSEIAKGLQSLVDSKTGERVVRKVYDSTKIYSGPYVRNAPDLVVGYFEGFRTSWQTAMGAVPEPLFEDNIKKWSGDHLIDPRFVPGIFLSNKRFRLDEPSIMDIGPTILNEFGIQKRNGFDGKILSSF